MRNKGFVIASIAVLVFTVVWISTASAARIADIRNTKHNFSSTVIPNILGGGDARDVKSTAESEICIFCHTPHGANLTEGPLWNREIPASSTYTIYTSGSIDSSIQQPNGVSKLCLSCHDGSIAIGSVRNRAGSGGFNAGGTIAMTGTSAGGVMAPGEGSGSGYTRFLGKDLSNDHPVSLTYNQALFVKDGEMRDPTQDPIRVRGMNPRPQLTEIHLQPEVRNSPSADTGQVQCVSCHDPHIRDTTDENIKFLRLNRVQKAAPDGSNTFLPATDIICLACHTKAGWETSAHAQPAIANETYTDAAADTREFPRGTQVWETACLTCHDTHTVSGSRRLLRAGTDAGVFTSSSGYNIKVGGGAPAIEATCYACHLGANQTLIGQGGANFEVPDVGTDFQLPRHMPITSAEQNAGFETHNIGDSSGLTGTSLDGLGKDFIEGPNNMGRDNVNDRHVECTDCHNPHRVVKRRSFARTNANGLVDSPALENKGTHRHETGVTHTNIASGVLRGIWGVEPVYGNQNFHTDPIDFTIKRGEPAGDPASTALTSTWLTREYQVCLKCHSNFAFPNGYAGPPLLGLSTATTPSGTNGMTRYTNVAREYNSPDAHATEPIGAEVVNLGLSGGAGVAPNNGNPPPNWNFNNHRSWHPVMKPTGRTATIGNGGGGTPANRRSANAANWTVPFRAVGIQTMYCTDCHGSDTANGTAIPAGAQPNGAVWGPHGSTNNFLLKGPWSGNGPAGQTASNDGTGLPGTGVGAQNHLCFKCHEYNQYAGNGSQDSGYAIQGQCMGMCMGGMGGMNNLHTFHVNMVGTDFRCNLCHVAVPHGWKNKVFLVNLNDVGLEGGFPNGANQVRQNTTAGYVNSPYYNRAALKVRNFSPSGNWNPNNCGSAGPPGNGNFGVTWMAFSSEACVNVP